MKYDITNYFRNRDETPWKVDALCAKVPTELFYPERGRMDDLMAAKVFCRECPVMMKCRNYALDNAELWGVWGGMSERERKRIRRQRAKPEPEHGMARYRRGCKCKVCTAANRARQRRVRAS